MDERDEEITKRLLVMLMNRYDMRPSVAAAFLGHVDEEAQKFIESKEQD